MKCPHCRIAFHDYPQVVSPTQQDADGYWAVVVRKCPACGRDNVHLGRLPENSPVHYVDWASDTDVAHTMVYPRVASKPPAPPEVPAHIAEDFNEASLVLSDSPKASAALSRRCLQTVLREAAKVKPRELFHEIQEAMDNQLVPSYLADNIDAIRNIGNFAAHPIKSTATGDVVPVEPGEAEWNLEVLEQLFDHFYVQPAVAQQRRAALNQKLKDSNKPPMKS